MKAMTFAIRSFGRELRSGEVIVLLSAVALAVGVLTAVGFLTDRIGKAVARQANEVLAADLRLRSQDPVPDNWRDQALQYDLETAETQTFPSVFIARSFGAPAIRWRPNVQIGSPQSHKDTKSDNLRRSTHSGFVPPAVELPLWMAKREP